MPLSEINISTDTKHVCDMKDGQIARIKDDVHKGCLVMRSGGDLISISCPLTRWSGVFGSECQLTMAITILPNGTTLTIADNV